MGHACTLSPRINYTTYVCTLGFMSSSERSKQHAPDLKALHAVHAAPAIRHTCVLDEIECNMVCGCCSGLIVRLLHFSVHRLCVCVYAWCMW